MVISPRSAQPVMVSSRFRRSRYRSTVARLRSLCAAISSACSLVPSGSCPLSESTSRSVSSWRAMSKGERLRRWTLAPISARSSESLSGYRRTLQGTAVLPSFRAAITRRCPLMMRHVFSPSGVTTMSSKKPSCSTERMVERNSSSSAMEKRFMGLSTRDATGSWRVSSPLTALAFSVVFCRVEKMEGLFLPAMDQPSILASISSHRAA